MTFHSDYISNIDATVTSCVNVIKVKTNCNYIDILPDNKKFLLINYQFDHSKFWTSEPNMFTNISVISLGQGFGLVNETFLPIYQKVIGTKIYWPGSLMKSKLPYYRGQESSFLQHIVVLVLQ